MNSRLLFAIAAGLCLLITSCGNYATRQSPQGVKPFGPSQPKPIINTWPTADGFKLPYLKALPKSGKPKAVVVLATGLDGVTSDYRSLTQALTKQGYAVYGIENRSTVYGPKSEQGNPHDWQPWVADFRGFEQQVRTWHPGVPVFWHGHSFGAVTALAALTETPKNELPRGLILHSPGMALLQKSNVFEAGLGRCFGWFRIKHISLMESLNRRITEDDTWDWQWKASDDRVRRGIAVRYVTQARKMGQAGKSVLSHLPVPTLALWGTVDKLAPGLASYEDYKAFMNTTVDGTDVTRRSFEQGGHILTEGPTQASALATITAWLDQQ